MADIGSSNVVVETFRIVFDDNLALTFALVFSLYELLVQTVVIERLHERTEFLLLIITS